MKTTDYIKSNPTSEQRTYGHPYLVLNPEELPDEWMTVAGRVKCGGVVLNGKRQSYVIAANPDRILQFVHDNTKPIGQRLLHDPSGRMVAEVVKGDVYLLPLEANAPTLTSVV